PRDEQPGTEDQTAEKGCEDRHCWPHRAWRVIATPRIATTMNTIVAAIERGERRAMPQIPCPDVQPLPRRVPKPTSRPVIATTIQLGGIAGAPSARPRAIKASGAAIRPAMKAMRQAQSLAS